MRSFIVFLCLVPTLLFARQTQLETQLKEAIKGKKAEIGIAVIIDGKDTIYNTYNLLCGNDDWDPMNIKPRIVSMEKIR